MRHWFKLVILSAILIIFFPRITLSENAKDARKDENDIVSESESANTPLKVARLAYSARKYKRALELCTQVLKDQPNSRDARLLRANCYSRIGDYKPALEDLKIAKRLAPKDAEISRGLGVVWRELGDFDQSLKHLNIAIKLNPANYQSIQDRGKVFIETRAFADAIKDFTHVIEQQPSNLDAHAHRAKCYYELGELSKAFVDVDAALAIDENYAYGYIVRGSLSLKMGQTDKALADFNKLETIEANSVTPHLLKAIAYRQSQQVAKAKAELQKALKVDSKCEDALIMLGDIQDMQGLTGDAISSYRQALQQHGKQEETALNRLAFTLACAPDAKFRDYDKAIQYANMLCTSTKYRNWKMLSLLATTYAQAGQFETALRWQKSAVRASTRI